MDQAGFLFFSRIFTYGDIPLETHLETIDEYLDKFDSLEMDTSVPREKRFESASTVLYSKILIIFENIISSGM